MSIEDLPLFRKPGGCMNQYIVLYRTKNMAPLDPPFGFVCHADDPDHAEEQLVNAEPDADVVWVAETDNYQDALADYFDQGDV